MRRSGEFARTIRSGARAGRPTLVLHVLPDAVDTPAAADAGPGASGPLVGFVVSRAVGGAVVRTAVKRRLRHQVASRLDRLPAGSTVVVRALPPSATSSSADLGADLDRALVAVTRTIARRSGPVGARS